MPWVDVSENDPGRVDQALRAAMHTCWSALPAEKQELNEFERVFRRLVDRAFHSLREDAELFLVQAAVQEEQEEAL